MSEFNNRIPVDAILWDFDGTLANSAAKNIAITRQILSRVAPRLTGENLPTPLASEVVGSAWYQLVSTAGFER